MRYEDSPELFGVGVGTGTCGDITCDICGAKYNEGEDERGIYDNDSVSHTTFAGLTVCDCCFEKIEDEIICRMSDILSWYYKIIKKRLANDRQRFDNVKLVKLLEDYSKDKC